MSVKKRLFIGIMASQALQEMIQSWSADKQDWPLRWVAPHNLHITLVPPFEDDPERILESLDGFEFDNQIDLVIKKIELGPKGSPPRLIWARGQESRDLERLKSSLESSLGFQSDRRKFIVHMTLAKIKSKCQISLSELNLPEQVNWQESVVSIELIESTLSFKGAEYRVIKSFPLLDH